MDFDKARIIIASDIHGSRFYCEKLMDAFKNENADYMILLGDLYYHGARNKLPNGYEPRAVIVMLNSIADRLTVVRGNCDSDVDKTVSDFELVESAQLLCNGKRFFFTHGNKFDKNNPPKNFGDILIYGHTHISFIEKNGDKIFANPGSISLPKNNTERAYLLLYENTLTLKDLYGNELNSITID